MQSVTAGHQPRSDDFAVIVNIDGKTLRAALRADVGHKPVLVEKGTSRPKAAGGTKSHDRTPVVDRLRHAVTAKGPQVMHGAFCPQKRMSRSVADVAVTDDCTRIADAQSHSVDSEWRCRAERSEQGRLSRPGIVNGRDVNSVHH